MAETPDLDALATCPLCHGANVHQRVQWAECKDCLTTAPLPAWNLRTPSPRTARVEEALRKARDFIAYDGQKFMASPLNEIDEVLEKK